MVGQITPVQEVVDAETVPEAVQIEMPGLLVQVMKEIQSVLRAGNPLTLELRNHALHDHTPNTDLQVLHQPMKNLCPVKDPAQDQDQYRQEGKKIPH